MEIEDLAVGGGCDIDVELGERVPVLFVGAPIKLVRPVGCSVGEPISRGTKGVFRTVADVVGVIKGRHSYDAGLDQTRELCEFCIRNVEGERGWCAWDTKWHFTKAYVDHLFLRFGCDLKVISTMGIWRVLRLRCQIQMHLYLC